MSADYQIKKFSYMSKPEIEAAKSYDKKALELGFDVQALNFKEDVE